MMARGIRVVPEVAAAVPQQKVELEEELLQTTRNASVQTW